MRIFLTGGTGFIGSHFINQAHEAGHEIVALRRSPQSFPRIPILHEPTWINKRIPELDSDDFKGCETLVHLAAHSANVPYDTLENCLIHNVLEPVAMLRTAVNSGTRRVINAGSCFEYGSAGERYEFIPTHAPLEPTASYPASKAAASVAFHTLACEMGFELLTLRIFQVYGEGELETRFWPSLVKAAVNGKDFPMTDGLQIRDFVPVEEVTRSFVLALERNDLQAGHPVIENIGSGIPRTLLEFASSEWERLKAAGRLVPNAIPLRENEVMRYVPEI